LKNLFLIVFIYSSFFAYAQEEYTNIQKDSIHTINYEIALKPTRVAFYSAILPGLGQAYNKKYWKLPLVYGALGTSTYFVVRNNKKYHEYRDDYKKKKLGDESIELPLDVLQKAQEYHKKKRDGNMLLVLATYILQIVEASVDAHLQYHNIDEKLSFSPTIIQDPFQGNTQLMARFSFKF